MSEAQTVIRCACHQQMRLESAATVGIHKGKRNEDGGVPLCENQSEEFHSGGVFLKRSEDQDLFWLAPEGIRVTKDHP